MTTTATSLATCSVCAQEHPLYPDGTIRTHPRPQGVGSCPGSRRIPADPDALPVLLTPVCGDWTAQAACATHDPEWWFATSGQQEADARRICRGCAVRTLCLQWALDIGAQFGTFGGHSPAERALLRRRRNRAMA